MFKNNFTYCYEETKPVFSNTVPHTTTCHAIRYIHDFQNNHFLFYRKICIFYIQNKLWNRSRNSRSGNLTYEKGVDHDEL